VNRTEKYASFTIVSIIEKLENIVPIFKIMRGIKIKSNEIRK